MKCQYSLCPNEVEIQSGHRPRKYCSDSCKQNAYRARLDEAARQAEELARQERERQAKAFLRQEYGDLLPDTIELLYQLRQSGHYNLVQSIGWAIVAERERVTHAQERARLAHAIMNLGEPDYHSIIVADAGHSEFVILGGRDAWQGFTEKASLEHLRTIYELYIEPIERNQLKRAKQS
ncbi:hypothetical protein KDW_17650 [Dictyobacter vulcani]|uniref:Uncharacterized protein n=1 Tax=Dictyobacter vulcani TaxID=2607529 RepID=A0A5J4KIQ9_9CHLR|nr:hypothetical protein [Dictyobacter vulcani]GER87603.1 hypothetical protein KDW_17650 [Dictyobacter vulcani]